MAEHNTRRSRNFGRWLKYKRGTMPQSEAVQRMYDLHKIKVAIETWSRWETGQRLPPEKKIDAIADAVDAPRARARRLAGYKAPITGGQGPVQTPIDLVQTMLQTVMKHEEPETRMLDLYLQLFNYDHQHKSEWRLKLGRDLELMQSIARVYETLNNFSHGSQMAALMRIKRICEVAQDLPLKTSPADTATLSFPPHRHPPIHFGAKVTIICEEGTAEETTYNYIVDEVQSTVKKELIAKLLYIQRRRPPQLLSDERG